MSRSVRGFRPGVLRELRQERGWSLRDLGVRLGVARTQVWNWEDGRTVPSAPVLAALAAEFGVDPLTLIDPSPDGPTLHDLRVQRGMTAKKLAERARLSYEGMVHRLDVGLGPVKVNPRVIERLALVLGVSPPEVAAACEASRQARHR